MLNCNILDAKVLEIQEGLELIKKKVAELETKQKTVLGEPFPEESK